MQKVVNINRKIREYLARQLEQFYHQTDSKEEALTLYFDFVWELKKEKGEPFYQMIIELCFSDTCRLLHFFNLYDRLSDDMVDVLNQIDQFKNIDDIEDFIEENPQYFSMLIQAPLKFQLFSLQNQASMLLMDQSVIHYFDTFHTLEMQSVFRDRTLEEIRKTYEKNELNTDALQQAFEQLIILSIGNIPQFQKVLLTLVKKFYKLSKAIEHNSMINLTDLGKNIIIRVEEGSIDNLLYELTYSEEIIKEMLRIYLSLIPLYEATYQQTYEKDVSEDIKQKLKEI